METQRYWSNLGLDQKQNYQRNLLVANLLVVAVMLLGLLPAAYLAQHKQRPGGRGGGSGGHENVLRGIPAMRMASIDRRFKGGFVEDFKIIPDKRESEPSVVIARAMHYVSFEPEIDNAVYREGLPDGEGYGNGEGYGYGDGYGGYYDADFGLPTENWWDRFNPRVELPSIGQFGVNKEALVLVGRIEWPGNPANPADTGLVVVDITIDEDGTISYEFLLEQPPGVGFRRVTEHALVYDYEYAPRIVNGRAVETTVRLVVRICRHCDLRIQDMDEQGLVQFGLRN